MAAMSTATIDVVAMATVMAAMGTVMVAIVAVEKAMAAMGQRWRQWE